MLGEGKGPDTPVFDVAYTDLHFMWTRAREEAKLTHLRFKDLRAQFSIYAEKAGIHLTTVMKTMGHESEARTRLYQLHNAVMNPRTGGRHRAGAPRSVSGRQCVIEV